MIQLCSWPTWLIVCMAGVHELNVINPDFMTDEMESKLPLALWSRLELYDINQKRAYRR